MQQEEITDKGLLRIKFISPLFREMTDDEFLQFCELNDPLNFEKDKFGNIIAMAPTGSNTERNVTTLLGELSIWNKKNKKGYIFGSSAGFTLPNSAVRSPDVSYILKEKWDILSEYDKEIFAPLCPDFVAEVKSPSDRISELHEKMNEYIENGAHLGWLIDIKKEEVYIYKPLTPVITINNFDSILDGGEVLPGFQFDLKDFKNS